MKLILLAATAMFATPVIAQDTAPQTQTEAAADPAAAADPTAPEPAADPMQSAPPAAQTMGPQTTGGTATAGGYAPQGGAMQGTPQPGAQVVFRAAPSPSEAFPPPAAKDSYPVCKKGQYDGCRQRGGK
ncbi:hypothetical protein [uncultured Sphingomonas sp.]|uniref:hypothetical protein n=1 Tax=uncultured Sphingomonas sp. TaxID=158754 RepID=UPI00261D0CA3|nr:hypothetical protein [uncultured Sphingomonas sp.]